MRFKPRARHGWCCQGAKRSGAARAAPDRPLMPPGCDIIATLAATAEFFEFPGADEIPELWRNCHSDAATDGCGSGPPRPHKIPAGLPAVVVPANAGT